MSTIVVNANDVHDRRHSIESAEMVRWSVANEIGHAFEFEVLDEGGHVLRITFPLTRRRPSLAVPGAVLSRTVAEVVVDGPRIVSVTAIVHVDEPMPPCVLARGRLT